MNLPPPEPQGPAHAAAWPHGLSGTHGTQNGDVEHSTWHLRNVGGVLEKLENVGKYGGKPLESMEETIIIHFSSIKSWTHDFFGGIAISKLVNLTNNSLDK